ncbi:MAG TPA: glycoside hydrolase [Firmicutes bacterium]|nr:glycoside hydrolase [Bacillota bacterium]HBR33122.1 glycoside hydrolase [Bacillota bacterium]
MGQHKYTEIARQFLGIPYRHGGRDENGLDCLGLAHFFYKELGISLPTSDGLAYTANWYQEDPERLLRGLLKVGRAVDLKKESLEPADLVYFRVGGTITHAGVMIDPHSFLHVMIGQQVHITYLNPAWRRRLRGARRLI